MGVSSKTSNYFLMLLFAVKRFVFGFGNATGMGMMHEVLSWNYGILVMGLSKA